MYAHLFTGAYPAIALVVILFVDFKKAEKDIAESLQSRKTDNNLAIKPNADPIKKSSVVPGTETVTTNDKIDHAITVENIQK